MPKERPYCLSIAGFDPSGGAGVLSDIKVFENNAVYGFGVATALTFQNDDEFVGVNWVGFDKIEKQLMPLEKYAVEVAKIGLVESLESLAKTVELLRRLFPGIVIIWDPILKSSSGFEFHEKLQSVGEVLDTVDLVTPNYIEYVNLDCKSYKGKCAILLKGGHRDSQKGTDKLFVNEEEIDIQGEPFEENIGKHGTGCVLSSAIASNIAKGMCVIDACKEAKKYVEKFILSNKLNLGYHD